MLYMVILLIPEFDEKLPYIFVKKREREKADLVSNITPHTLINT